MCEMKDNAVESSASEPVAEEQIAAPQEAAPAVEAPPQPAIDWQDRCLRLAAEFDNFRKRTAREYAQIIKSAEEQLIGELTDVLDNLQRALDPEHRNAKSQELIRGIELIHSQFKSVLEKRGLVRMHVIGEPFDPEKHDALLQIESAEIPEGHVAREVAPGYLLGEKVIRHAKVVVSHGPAKQEPSSEE